MAHVDPVDKQAETAAIAGAAWSRQKSVVQCLKTAGQAVLGSSEVA